MRVLNLPELENFKQEHGGARSALSNWVRIMQAGQWTDLADMKKRGFNSVDYVSGHGCVFNVGGNNTRILATISLAQQQVVIRWVKTHTEYDKWNARR